MHLMKKESNHSAWQRGVAVQYHTVNKRSHATVLSKHSYRC